MPAETQVLKNAGEENATKTLCMAAETVECDFKPANLMRRAVGDEDVLIDMKYCGVCHSDLSFAAGHMSGILGAVKFPCVPGHELAGVVAAVGKDVAKFAVGDHHRSRLYGRFLPLLCQLQKGRGASVYEAGRHVPGPATQGRPVRDVPPARPHPGRLHHQDGRPRALWNKDPRRYYSIST